MCQMYAYVQTTNGIGDYWSGSSIAEDYYKIVHPNFKVVQLEKKEDIWN